MLCVNCRYEENGYCTAPTERCIEEMIREEIDNDADREDGLED